MDYNNILAQYEDSSSLGLENGRCGLVLLNFLLSEKDEKYKERAFIHLNYLLDHVYESTSLSFNEGLMGIGWTLEFLTQNQYISNSCDNLLHEIDDIIYKWVNFHQWDSFSLNNGYIGTLLYFCYRLKGDRILLPNRELALKECTITILGKLYAESKKQTDKKEPDNYNIAQDISELLLTLRKELGISQRQLSEITGIPQANISRIENGHYLPSLLILKRLADGLGRRLTIDFIDVNSIMED